MNIVTKVCSISASCCLLMSFTGPVLAVEDSQILTIEANTTYTVSKAQSELFLKEWVVGDNATITFDEDVSRWHLEAAKVTLGSGVVIDGSALPGSQGGIGKSMSGSADKCTDGKAGEDGGHGANGDDGLSISMRLVIQSIGSVAIRTNGGDGGAGGRGGAGQQAGKVERCSGPDGGVGGQGGDGGDGGNGGFVRIAYSYAPSAETTGALSQYVTIENKGGLGGVGASGGNGGGGAEGKYINMRTLTGSKKWMPAGHAGATGRSGKKGRVGVAGQTIMDRDLEGQMNVIVSSQSQQQGSVADLRRSMAEERSLAAQKAEAAAAELAKVNAELALFKQQSEALKAQVSSVVSESAQTSVSAATETASLQEKIIALEAALNAANTQLAASIAQVDGLTASITAIEAKQVAVDEANQQSKQLIEQLLERVSSLEKRPVQQVIQETVVQEKAVPAPAAAPSTEKTVISQ